MTDRINVTDLPGSTWETLRNVLNQAIAGDPESLIVLLHHWHCVFAVLGRGKPNISSICSKASVTFVPF